MKEIVFPTRTVRLGKRHHIDYWVLSDREFMIEGHTRMGGAMHAGPGVVEIEHEGGRVTVREQREYLRVL